MSIYQNGTKACYLAISIQIKSLLRLTMALSSFWNAKRQNCFFKIFLKWAKLTRRFGFIMFEAKTEQYLPISNPNKSLYKIKNPFNVLHKESIIVIKYLKNLNMSFNATYCRSLSVNLFPLKSYAQFKITFLHHAHERFTYKNYAKNFHIYLI